LGETATDHPEVHDEVETAWMENRAPQAPTRATWVSPGGYHTFEHQWAMIEAFRFYHQIGRNRVAERIHALNEQCKEQRGRRDAARNS
jgi:selenocysteine lyase/cysteine desulfurase